MKNPGSKFLLLLGLVLGGPSIQVHANGKAWVWGTTSPALTNIPPAATNLIAIAGGDYHLVALKSNGKVVAWGEGSFSWPPGPNPVTNVPPSLNGVIAIAAGSSHNLALRSNGTVVAWGNNDAGQTDVPAGLSNIVAVAAGSIHSLALTAEGRIIAWGGRSLSTPPSLTNVPTSLSNVVAIASAWNRNLALIRDGRVAAWGISSTYVPASLSNVIAVACGPDGVMQFPTPRSFTVNLALITNGTVVSWSTTGTPYPSGTPLPPSGLSNVVSISAVGHGMALRADGTVVQWGLSNPPATLTNAFAIAAGAGFAAALTADGSPRFTIQPLGQTVTNGVNALFHARAVGIPPLRYQWQLDDLNLNNATNSDLVISNAQGSLTGDYRVVVSNAVGRATSVVAVLSVPCPTNLDIVLGTTNLIWRTIPASAPPWFSQNRETHDGFAAAQSGAVGHSQYTTLSASLVGPGVLSFWWKTSSKVYWDQLMLATTFPRTNQSISGQTDWQEVKLAIPSGPQAIGWIYSKSASGSAGQDAAWVDDVVFIPARPLALQTPHLSSDGELLFYAGDPGGMPLLPENLSLIEVQASTNLLDWFKLPAACSFTNGIVQICDTNRTTFVQRFYRVIQR